MGVQILAYAKPSDPGQGKFKATTGDIVTVRDESVLPDWPWGINESYPDYIKITVTDAVESEIDAWMVPLKNRFSFEIMRQRPQDVRYKISTDAKIVTAEPDAFPQELVDYVVNEFNASVFQSAIQAGWATFNIPTANFDEQAITVDIVDLFERSFALRRYRLQDSTVNQANANNGFLTMNLADFNNAMLDKMV